MLVLVVLVVVVVVLSVDSLDTTVAVALVVDVIVDRAGSAVVAAVCGGAARGNAYE